MLLRFKTQKVFSVKIQPEFHKGNLKCPTKSQWMVLVAKFAAGKQHGSGGGRNNGKGMMGM